jgi:hypothetical protein
MIMAVGSWRIMRGYKRLVWQEPAHFNTPWQPLVATTL